jgi:uncharacterized metal-binding protein YceD (DUF177 family)
MKVTNPFIIPFIGLKIGLHSFRFDIDNSFFESFGYNEFLDSTIEAEAILNKKSTLLEFELKHKGHVHVPCDLSNEVYPQPIEGVIKLVVKFGDEYNDEHDEMLIIPHGEYQVDLSQYFYESIVLSVPVKRIHPGIKDGTLKSEILEYLEYSEDEVEEHDEIDESTDPRWDSLKKLLIDKNNNANHGTS